jgi:predicted porin
VLGLDFSGDDGKLYWYGQALWNRWNNFLDSSPTVNRSWAGGFLGADYIYSDRWVYSLLYNRASAKDFRGTNTIYEGITVNTLSATTTYYFMRNVKGIVEVNFDLQKKDNGPQFVGHKTQENSLLLGFDLAF